MTANTHSEPARPRRSRRSRLVGGFVAVAVAGALAGAVAEPAGAAAGPAAPAASVTTKLQDCGWNRNPGTDRSYYEHCATNTNVWIQVTRWARPDYHRCVGPGRTNLDYDATGAWYDSNFRGGLCSHPGDTA